MPRANRHTDRRTRTLLAIAFCGAVASIVGCSSPGDTTAIPVARDDYPRAFDAARETLLDYRFTLDRVDASAGVITTERKVSTGLASPWDLEQQSFADEWRDFTNRHGRTATIVFEPAPDGELTALFTVTLSREVLRGWNPETEAVGLTSRWVDPTAENRSIIPIKEDRAFAAVLARVMQERMQTERALAEATEPADTP